MIYGKILAIWESVKGLEANVEAETGIQSVSLWPRVLIVSGFTNSLGKRSQLPRYVKELTTSFVA